MSCCNKNCYDCPTSDPYIQKIRERTSIKSRGTVHPRRDHAEATSKDANYYIGSKLVARVPVKVFRAPTPTSDVIATYNKGQNIGVIQSWVLVNGVLWWDVNWFSGRHQGWIKHEPALFNTKVAEATASGKQHAEVVAKQIELMNRKEGIEKLASGIGDAVGGVGNTLSFLGNNLKWIIAAVIVLVLIFFFMRYSGKL